MVLQSYYSQGKGDNIFNGIQYDFFRLIKSVEKSIVMDK
jgi:hypothetical protein